MSTAKQKSTRTAAVAPRRSSRITARKAKHTDSTGPPSKPAVRDAKTPHARLAKIKLLTSFKPADETTEPDAQHAQQPDATPNGGARHRAFPGQRFNPTAVRMVRERLMSGKMHNPTVRRLTGSYRAPGHDDSLISSANQGRKGCPSAKLAQQGDAAHPPTLTPSDIVKPPSFDELRHRGQLPSETTAARHIHSPRLRSRPNPRDVTHAQSPAARGRHEISSSPRPATPATRVPLPSCQSHSTRVQLDESDSDQWECLPMDSFARTQTEQYQRHLSLCFPATASAPSALQAIYRDAHTSLEPTGIPSESFTHQLSGCTHRVTPDVEELRRDIHHLEKEVRICRRQYNDLVVEIAGLRAALEGILQQ